MTEEEFAQRRNVACNPSDLRGGTDFYTISKHTGMMEKIVKCGKDMLAAPVQLSAWRAPTDNDRAIKYLWGHYNTWEGENLDRIFNKVRQITLNGHTVICDGVLSGIGRMPFLSYHLEYEFFADGAVKITLTGDVREDCIWLPRLGFEFVLRKELSRFRYYGKGPQENYCDMHYHTTTGLFESTAEDEYVPYTMPQEHGNHIGCKNLYVYDALEFFSDDAFEMNVSKYSKEQLTNARHINEIGESKAVCVRIDYKVSGIGSGSCGAQLLDKYKLNEKKIRYSFYMK